MRPIARFRAAGLALLVAVAPARAAILVSETGGGPAAPEQVIADSIQCVAAVLAYRTSEAENICTRVIQAMPEESLGYKFRGIAHLLEQRFTDAEADFREAVRLAPDDPENQAGFAQALSGQGRYAASLPYFDAALEIAPDDIRFLTARCWARAGLGGDDMLDKALMDCNRAADLAPDYPLAKSNRGLVRLKQQNWRTAIQDYTRAIDMGEDSPAALFGRGYAWLQLKEEAEARADIRAARKANSTIDELFIRLGVLPASCRQRDGACPLPPDLRAPDAAHGLEVMVSYRPSQPEIPHDLDAYVRRIALGRMDTMLDRTAGLLGTSAYNDFSPPWEDESLPDAIAHLRRIQMEYRRQQALACASGLAGGKLCDPPAFHASSAMADDPVSLRMEVDHTFNAVQPFWQAVCRATKSHCRIE